MSKQTKAQQVRSIIAQAKAHKTAAEQVLESVMCLGLARQLARAYIKNNWDRVEAAVGVSKVKGAARELSMTKGAIRKREARAARRAAAL